MLPRRVPAHLPLLALLGLLAASPAVAQNPAVDSIQHRNECRRAVQVLRTGSPGHRLGWATSYVTRCRDAGPDLAALVLDPARTEARDMGVFVRLASMLVDADVFDAALTVAADERRTAAARVQAIRVMHEMLMPGTRCRTTSTCRMTSPAARS